MRILRSIMSVFCFSYHIPRSDCRALTKWHPRVPRGVIIAVLITSCVFAGFPPALIGLVPVHQAQACNEPFAYRKEITINSGQISGGPHTNFPMLVSLKDNDLRSTTNGGHLELPNGYYDIIFRALDDTTCDVAGGGTNPCTLDHEIESYIDYAAVSMSGSWSTGLGSYTVPAGNNRLLVFVTSYENSTFDPGIEWVRFGGVDLDPAIGRSVTTSGYYARVEIWYLKDADIPAGSKSFTIRYNGGVSIGAAAHAYAVFTNVDQTDPPTVDTDSGTATAVTVTTDNPFNVVSGGMSVSGAVWFW
jgi:hypothetical protein